MGLLATQRSSGSTDTVKLRDENFLRFKEKPKGDLSVAKL
jgi:hypothetical protein